MEDELPEDLPDPPESLDGAIIEPSTTQIPEGVDVPVETPYGKNQPVELPIEKVEDPAPNTKKTENQKSIKIPGVPFLIILIAILGGAFMVGNTIAPKEKIAENPKPQEQNKGKLTNFIQDLGIYKREKAIDTNFMVGARLEMGKSQIFVVTGNPGAPKLLAALLRKREATGIPIYILTGNDTPQRESDAAKKEGFAVYRLPTTLERPYTTIIIDNKLVLDASRDQWFWETSEKEVVESTKQWAADLLKGAAID